MSDTLVLLRGVNVGGHRKLPMADLRALAEGLGHTGAKTYIQSGNLAFDRACPLEDVKAGIEAALQEVAGITTFAVVRSREQLDAVADAHPFFDHAEQLKWLHLTFLEQDPDPDKLAAFDPAEWLPEELAVAGRHLYLHVPNGMAKTRFDQTWLDRRFGVRGTTRNWRTVGKLIDLMRA